jgi:putative ABC transport system substrate-binding protein
MRRREFLGGLGGTAAWPFAAHAQRPAKTPRVGFLGLTSAVSHAPRLEAFRSGLRDLGYVEGKDIQIEYRWAEQNYDRVPALIDELIRLNVDVIVTHAVPGTLGAAKATTTIPIVITAVADLVLLGVVSNLSRPDRNVTGLSIFSPELLAKRVDLIKDILPSLTRVAAIMNADNPIGTRLAIEEAKAMAVTLKIDLVPIEVRGQNDFERAFATIAREKINAAVVHEDPSLIANSQQIAELAARHRLPMCGFPEFARAGGLIGYGINFPDMERRAATFVDKIIKGAKPADLPVERATKFTTIINLKAAKALAVDLPASTLVRADEVIE